MLTWVGQGEHASKYLGQGSCILKIIVRTLTHPDRLLYLDHQNGR